MQPRWTVGKCRALALVALVAAGACSREPKLLLPKIGQTMSLMPIAVNSVAPVTVDYGDARGLRLLVNWGGRAINAVEGNPVLKFYGAADPKTPVYSAAWADLEVAWKHTGCTDDMIAAMDGTLMGQALLCDGGLDIRKIVRIEAVDEAKGEVRTATQWTTWKQTDDVVTVTVSVY
jgi:hypothetical protein